MAEFNNGKNDCILILNTDLGCLVRPVNLHFPVQSVVEEKIVGHPHSVRLHGVALSIIIIPNVTIIVVAYFRFAVALHFDSISVKVQVFKTKISLELGY